MLSIAWVRGETSALGAVKLNICDLLFDFGDPICDLVEEARAFGLVFKSGNQAEELGSPVFQPFEPIGFEKSHTLVHHKLNANEAVKDPSIARAGRWVEAGLKLAARNRSKTGLQTRARLGVDRIIIAVELACASRVEGDRSNRRIFWFSKARQDFQ